MHVVVDQHRLVKGFGVAFIALLVCCSPQTERVSFAPPTKALSADEYPDIRDRWTREGQVINDFVTAIRVFATLRAPEFNAAYTAYFAKIHEFADREQAALAEELAAQWDRSYPVVLVAATYERADNDIEQRDSIWHMSLRNDAMQQVSPAKIERTERVTVTLKDLYPHIGPFDRVYTVEFPRHLPEGDPLVTSSTKSLTFNIAGPLGNVALTWDLRN